MPFVTELELERIQKELTNAMIYLDTMREDIMSIWVDKAVLYVLGDIEDVVSGVYTDIEFILNWNSENKRAIENYSNMHGQELDDINIQVLQGQHLKRKIASYNQRNTPEHCVHQIGYVEEVEKTPESFGGFKIHRKTEVEA